MSEDEKPTTEESDSAKPKDIPKLFSLIEMLGMFCLYAGVACLIITYFAKYGFTFSKLSWDQVKDLFSSAARVGLIFALVFGLPIWLAREYNSSEH